MSCPNCGSELPAAARFCGDCGSAVPATVEPTRTPETGTMCPNCGNELPDGARFCGECGSSMVATAPPVEPAPDLPTDDRVVAPEPAPPVVAKPPQAVANPAPVAAVEPPPASESPAPTGAYIPPVFETPSTVRATETEDRGRKPLWWFASPVAVVVAALVIASAVRGGTNDGDLASTQGVTADDRLPAATRVPATPPPATAPSTTVTVPLTTVARRGTTQATAAPVTTPITVTSPTTELPVTVPPPTAPATTTALTAPSTTAVQTGPTTVVVVFNSEIAVDRFSAYLNAAAERRYPDAWAMLSGPYQVKYLGYENFVDFWETVDGAGIARMDVIRSTPEIVTLRMEVWFGRRIDGTVSNELVETDLAPDPATGQVFVTDYRYLGAL